MESSVPNPDRLLKAFNNDLELMEFFHEWSKNGHNATRAYLEVKPGSNENSARVLGSRMLAKVDKPVIMREYGLGEIEYFQQLKDGMGATRWNEFTGEREPDHKTRLAYHNKVGKLLGVESEQQGSQTNVQVNFGDFVKNV